MILPDVNVLVYAFRQDAERHEEYRSWLLQVIRGDSAFGLSEQVLSAVIRLSTHARVFKKPSTFVEAAGFTTALRSHPLCRIVQPTADHWDLFIDLCQRADAKANLITDAWFAALAIGSGCTWITADRDYARFPGLKWMHPLDGEREKLNLS